MGFAQSSSFWAKKNGVCLSLVPCERRAHDVGAGIKPLVRVPKVMNPYNLKPLIEDRRPAAAAFGIAEITKPLAHSLPFDGAPAGSF